MASIDALPLESIISILGIHFSTGNARLGLTILAAIFGYQKYRHLDRRVSAIEANTKPMDTQTVEFIESPNKYKGRPVYRKVGPLYIRTGMGKIQGVVVHQMEGTIDSAIRHFQDASSQVSSHYLVSDLRAVQMVLEEDEAWHCRDGNPYFIGIEHEGWVADAARNRAERRPTAATLERGQRLAAKVLRKHGLFPSAVTVRPHRSIVNTQCPAGIDMDAYIRSVQAFYVADEAPLPVDSPIGPSVSAKTVSAPSEPLQATFAPFLSNLAPSQAFNAEVSRLQFYLFSKGYMSDPGEGRGYYGPKTQKAVDSFQKAHGIAKASQYGWWYDKTREEANKDLNYTKQA